LDDHSTDLLYIQVKKTITDDILSGVLKPGDRLLTTMEMAREYKVCHRTVQRAMSTLVKEGLVVRRPHYGSFVASSDRKKLNIPLSEQSVYVFLAVLDESFTSLFYIRDMLSGIQSAAAKIGCQVKMGLYSTIATIPRDQSVAGLLLICPLREEAAALKRLEIPAVQLDVSHPRLRMGSVKTHNQDGVMQGIRHLVRLGHKQILYVHSDMVSPGCFSAKERYEGFEQACQKFGLPFEDYTVAGEDLSARLKGKPFTAIMTDGYASTVTALDILRDRGISIPHGVSFVGYDDIELAEHMAVPITVVRQQLQEVGATALNLLLDGSDKWQNANILVRPELVVRSSTKAVQRR